MYVLFLYAWAKGIITEGMKGGGRLEGVGGGGKWGVGGEGHCFRYIPCMITTFAIYYLLHSTFLWILKSYLHANEVQKCLEKIRRV